MELLQWPATLLVPLSVFAMFSTFVVALSRSMNETDEVDYSRTPVEHGDNEKKDFNATNLDLEKSTNKDRKVQYNNTLVLHGDTVTERHLSRTYTIQHAVGGSRPRPAVSVSDRCWRCRAPR